MCWGGLGRGIGIGEDRGGYRVSRVLGGTGEGESCVGEDRGGYRVSRVLGGQGRV